MTRLSLLLLSLCSYALAQPAPDLEKRIADLEKAAKSAQTAGDNAWMLTSAALVLMMTGPGLALFYGGLVRRKNVLGTMMHSFASMVVIGVIWPTIGYALSFGPGILMNVNFPDCRPDEVQGIEVTRQGKRDVNLLHVDERVDMRGNNYYWLGFKRERGNPPVGTDLWAAFNRRISVTPLHFDLTDVSGMDALERLELGRLLEQEATPAERR